MYPKYSITFKFRTRLDIYEKTSISYNLFARIASSPRVINLLTTSSEGLDKV